LCIFQKGNEAAHTAPFTERFGDSITGRGWGHAKSKPLLFLLWDMLQVKGMVTVVETNEPRESIGNLVISLLPTECLCIMKTIFFYIEPKEPFIVLFLSVLSIRAVLPAVKCSKTRAPISQ
jgi:hypothetical protein